MPTDLNELYSESEYYAYDNYLIEILNEGHEALM